MKPTAYLLLLSTIFLSACSPLKPVQSAKVNIYTLNPPVYTKATKTPLQAQRVNGVLLVLRPTANPGYTTSAMVYVTQRYGLNRFAKNRWSAAPAVMLQPVLVDALREAKLFESVVGSPFTGKTKWELRAQIHQFHQSFETNPSLFSFKVNVDLIRAASGAVTAHKIFNITTTANSNTPYGGVVAANEAMANTMERIVLFVEKSINYFRLRQLKTAPRRQPLK